jgi:hypothetical protein
LRRRLATSEDGWNVVVMITIAASFWRKQLCSLVSHPVSLMICHGSFFRSCGVVKQPKWINHRKTFCRYKRSSRSVGYKQTITEHRVVGTVLPLRMREIPGSNLSPVTSYRNRSLSCFLVSWSKFWNILK